MSKFRYPYYPGTKSISKIVDKVAKPFLQKGGYAFATLILDWDKIIGYETANVTKPLKLIFQKRDEPQKLVLQVEPAAALMIGFQKGVIIEKITTFYGRKIVGDIVFEQTPLPYKKKHSLTRAQIPLPHEMEEELDTVLDDDLKNALKSLASAMIQKK
jgi:hypothetical protein